MTTTTTARQPDITMAAAIERCGGVPWHRIRLHPYPATEADVEAIDRKERRRFELIDGILVETDMGFQQGLVALTIAAILRVFVTQRRLGVVNGTDGVIRLAPGLVRIPDVAFYGWDQFPNRKVQATPIPDLHPDLAVEVLSENNTAAEMDAKLRDYFASGTRLAWLVDVGARTVTVFTTPDRAAAVTLGPADTLDGGPVLPGFAVPVRDLFADLDPH